MEIAGPFLRGQREPGVGRAADGELIGPGGGEAVDGHVEGLSAADERVFGMGRNNRQRRAAKQKARARRGPTAPRHRGAESELIDDLLGQFDDFSHERGCQNDGAIGAATRSRHQQVSQPPPTTGRRARDLLDRLLRWADAELSADAITRAMGRELSGQPSEVLSRVDELASQSLLQLAGALWEQGWQPRDLIHVAGRLDKWAAALAADLSVEQLRRSGRLPLAPPSWREQLEAAGDHAETAGIIRFSTESDWVAVDQLLTAGAAALPAWTSAIRLLARMRVLPPLAPTLPPPSAWAHAADPPRRAARPG
ncbi:MAG: hypothetical protein QM650_10095, partial [Microlunatus sp.]